mgnify:CR=1 FL=1
MKIKKAVIILCRLSSSRLPQKALKELNGITVLDWVLMSMSKVKANKYYVATDESSYEALKPICDRNKFEIFAGDLNNVLKRYMHFCIYLFCFLLNFTGQMKKI